MRRFDVVAAGEVGNGACHLQDAVVAARAEREAANRPFEQACAVCVQVAVLAKHTAG